MRYVFFGLVLFGIFSPQIALAVGTEVGEVQTFGDLVSQVWAWATQIIFGISVIMLIVGGLMYMAARGEEEKIGTAKEVITGALVSTMLMLFSGVLFTWLHRSTADVAGTATLGDATRVLQNITKILLGAVGGVSVLVLIYNGIQYMLAAGDSDKINAAKRGLFFSVGGLAIALTAYYLLGWLISIWT